MDRGNAPENNTKGGFLPRLEGYQLQPTFRESEDTFSFQEPVSPLLEEPERSPSRTIQDSSSAPEIIEHARKQPSTSEWQAYTKLPPSPSKESNGGLGPGKVATMKEPRFAKVSPQRLWLRAWRYGWTADGVGCTLAVISLMAIFITLRLHAHKPIPDWPFGISINALIAIFSVILKAGVALPLSNGISQSKWQTFQNSPTPLIEMEDLDSASRGPWGSTQFLFKFGAGKHAPFLWHRRDYWHYSAKFAALLTIVAFAIDPFTQQLVQFTSCDQLSTNLNATISRTNRYVGPDSKSWSLGDDVGGPLAVAINRALTDPPQNDSALVSTSCISGNCTFPIYTTLGVCHDVWNITEKVRLNRSYEDYFNAIISKSISLDIGTNHSITLHPLGSPDTLVSSGAQSGDPRNNPYETYLLMNVGDTRENISFSLRETQYIAAFKAQIYPCIRTYNTSVRNSALKEVEVWRQPIGTNLYGGYSSHYSFQLATTQTWVNGTSMECKASPKYVPGWEPVAKDNVDASPWRDRANSSHIEVLYYHRDCVWAFGNYDWMRLQVTLNKTLGNLTLDADTQKTYGSLTAKLLWHNGTYSLATVDSFLRSLTDTMTAAIRSNGEEGEGAYAQGRVIFQSTCVEIKWAWFSYHVVLVGLTAFYLVLVIACSPRGSALNEWKSSSLAVLFSSLDESLKEQTRAGMGRDEIFQTAKTMTAQLVVDSDGRARFV